MQSLDFVSYCMILVNIHRMEATVLLQFVFIIKFSESRFHGSQSFKLLFPTCKPQGSELALTNRRVISSSFGYHSVESFSFMLWNQWIVQNVILSTAIRRSCSTAFLNWFKDLHERVALMAFLRDSHLQLLRARTWDEQSICKRELHWSFRHELLLVSGISFFFCC